jgi:myo-inositol-1(or 4)-monophosphatase
MTELKELENLALRASALAEGIILRHYQTELSVQFKPDATPVTIADQQAEEAVRNFFAQETPDFGFIGEETGIANPGADWLWVLDPIDGTKSFVHEVPLFGTLLALAYKGEPVVGIIRLPALRQVLVAAKGAGAWLNGEQRVHCSTVNQTSEALVLSGTINTMEAKGYGDWFGNLRRGARLYRGWGDCYGYFMVATGRAEVMCDPVCSLWDIAPYPVIFAEAGGVFRTLQGDSKILNEKNEPLRPAYEGYNGLAHTRFLNVDLP